MKQYEIGDLIMNHQQNVYMYSYNPYLSKFMFRRFEPIEALWFEQNEMKTDNIKFIGNIFSDEGVIKTLRDKFESPLIMRLI